MVRPSSSLFPERIPAMSEARDHSRGTAGNIAGIPFFERCPRITRTYVCIYVYIRVSNHKSVVRAAYFCRNVADACGNYRQLPRKVHPVSELANTRDRTSPSKPDAWENNATSGGHANSRGVTRAGMLRTANTNEGDIHGPRLYLRAIKMSISTDVH